MPDFNPPDPAVETPRAEPASRRLSAVWLVPLLALIIALGVAYRSYSDRGPLIEIVFDNAAGIEAGQTQIRFRDVTVGVVEKLELSPNLTKVVATARIDKSVARFLDADAQFWVVRPSVSAQGVSGIETVISGVYIGASWNDQVGPRQSEFEALSSPPLTPPGQPGLRVQLRAPDGGSMNVGAPVLYKRIQVGKIESIQLTPAGDVLIDIFVNAPNHLRLTEGTRFWNASGFSISLSAAGASLNVDSLISLLQGGVSFAQVGASTEPVEEGHVYQLYNSEADARKNVVEEIPGQALQVDVDFDGSVRGLEPGAPVEFRGLTVGSVQSLQATIVTTENQPRLVLRTTLGIVPARLGITADSDEAAVKAALDLLASEVENDGLRAKLASSGLLQQTLFVDLAELPDPVPATLDRNAEPHPRLPSAPSDVSGVASSAEGVLNRVASLPLEDVVNGAVNLLNNINSLISDQRVRSAPENFGLLLADVRKLINQDGVQEAPAQIAAVLASARALIDQATQAQLVSQLTEVLATTKTAIASIGNAADEVPALLDQIEALSKTAQDLPLDQLVASATRLVEGLDSFVKSDKVANLPVAVEASLAELRGIVGDLRSGGAVENVNATLASVRQMTEDAQKAQLVARLNDLLASAETSIGSVGTAADAVPPLVAKIEALTQKAQDLPLDQLLASATDLVNGVDAFVRSDAVTALPTSVSDSLADLRGVIDDLRSGGAIDNANATLASVRQISDQIAAARLTESIQDVIAEARTAANNISTATSGVPQLIDTLNALSARLAALPLDQLVASGNQVLTTADSFLASPGVAEVPPKLADALEQLRATLAELREGGAVTNLNSTLASADQAAGAISTAAADLPALIAKYSAVADRANAALSSVSPDSKINRDTMLVLQEVRDAARSVTALAQALNRNPNSVLFGR